MIAAWLALVERLARGELPSPEQRRWVVQGTRRWLDGCPLEQALGLRPTRRDRDEALRTAAGLLGNDPRRLAAEISRFDRVWPRWSGLPEAPAQASQVQRCLYLAYGAGAVPRSTRHLRRIIRDKAA